MGLIKQQFTIEGIRKKRVLALIDTGANLSIIRPDIARAIQAGYSYSTTLQLPDGHKEKIDVLTFRLIIRNRFVDLQAGVYPIPEQLLLGTDFLQANKAFIDMSRDRLELNKYAPSIRKVYQLR